MVRLDCLDSWEFEGSVHNTVFKFLSNLLLKLFKLLLNFGIDITRSLQITAR